jgi:hypothetical protein
VAKLPEPPSPRELIDRTGPDVRSLPAGTLLWRIYFRGGRHPTTWSMFRAYGPTNGRFDHHLPGPRGETRHQEDRAILYLAARGPTCLAEAFQETRTIDRRSRDPWLVGFRIRRPVTLLDLTGTWPTRAGASMKIASGPRPTAQRWSRVIHAAYPEIEGIYYGSSMHANEPCVALYERAAEALPERPLFNRKLSDPTWLETLRNATVDLGYLLL